MSRRMTRRDAIKVGIGAVATGTLLSRARGQAMHAETTAQAFVTDATGQRHARFDALLSDGKADAAVSFRIDTQKPLQSILGFGACFTEAACSVLMQLAPADRAALFDELFNPQKIGFGIGRVCIGASDYSTKLYSYDEGDPDPTLSRFSIDHDRQAVIPILQQARSIRPDLFLFASPWSPPGWMKYSNSMLGGSIRPGNLAAYAQYILNYLQAYKAAGVPIDAMTIQNEIDADQYGAMPACTWPEEVEADFISKALGPLLAKHKMKTGIWILDHNYNLVGRVLDTLARPKVRKFVNAVAWHGYAGSPEQMMMVKKAHPDIDMHWTEGGDGVDSPTLATAWSRWGHQFAAILNNGCDSITCWNLALDEAGNPNIGPFHCGGLITVDSKTQAITRNGIFWALSHYSRAMVRGSQMLPCTQSTRSSISAAAAKRPDGLLAIVLSNGGASTRVRLDFDGARQPSQIVNLPKDSVATILL